METKSVYKVSGTLPEELKNAAMYVIDENGESYFAENAVSGDTFEIYLSDGTYLACVYGRNARRRDHDGSARRGGGKSAA